MKLIYLADKTEYFNRFKFTDFFDLYQPRISFLDIKHYNIPISKLPKYLRKEKISGKLFYVSPDKASELNKAKREVYAHFINSPLALFNIHTFLWECKAKAIRLVYPSSFNVRNFSKRCNLIMYCTNCNALFHLYHYPILEKYCNEIKKYYNNPKTLLLYLKNINLSFKELNLGIFDTLIELIEKEMNIKEYLIAVRPSFDIAKDKKETLFDIIFLSLLPFYQVSENIAISLYVLVDKILENFGKKSNRSILFDFECYEVDYYLYEVFDIITCMFYRIPVEIYWRNDINLNYYSYLFSYFVNKGKYFDNIQQFFSVKTLLRRIYEKIS